MEDQVCLLPYDDEIEFPKQRLTLGQQIGSGAFGRVVSRLLDYNKLRIIQFVEYRYYLLCENQFTHQFFHTFYG